MICPGDAQSVRLAAIEQRNLIVCTKACDVRITQVREVEHLGPIAQEWMVADEVLRKQQFRLVGDDDVSRRPRDGF